MLKYVLTIPKIAKLDKPVDEYLAGFSSNKALLDIIAQHFFQKNPAFFALSYFSLYLDYRYPRGGTGTLAQVLEQFILGKSGEIRRETEIRHVDPGKNQAIDSRGNIYRYRKLIWAADLKTLYRVIDLASLTNANAIKDIIISTLFDYSLTKHIQAMGWYDEFRKLMSETILNVIDASIYPGIKTAVFDSFTSTPLTIERISGNSEGAITGWAFTNDFLPVVNKLPKVASSVLTPIPDTYQAGQWTYSPSGMPISILTGKLTADRVLKDLA
jgi:phytoene dehydrogenase-like protein